MSIEQLEGLVESAFVSSTANPVSIPEHSVAENVTIQVQSYHGPVSSGFRVICRFSIPEINFVATRVKDSGPQKGLEIPWPENGLQAAVDEHVARCIQAGADFVNHSGFDADRKVILLNKLLKAKEENTVANFPKLTALYAWMETVQSMAIVGQTVFPKAPHSFEEVIKE